MPAKTVDGGIAKPHPQRVSTITNREDWQDALANDATGEYEFWLVAGNHKTAAIVFLAEKEGEAYLTQRGLEFIECVVVVNLEQGLARWYGNEHNLIGMSGMEDTQLDLMLVN